MVDWPLHKCHHTPRLRRQLLQGNPRGNPLGFYGYCHGHWREQGQGAGRVFECQGQAMYRVPLRRIVPVRVDIIMRTLNCARREIYILLVLHASSIKIIYDPKY